MNTNTELGELEVDVREAKLRTLEAEAAVHDLFAERRAREETVEALQTRIEEAKRKNEIALRDMV